MDSELSCKRLGKILSEIEVLNIEFDQLSKALKVYHAKFIMQSKPRAWKTRESANKQAQNV